MTIPQFLKSKKFLLAIGVAVLLICALIAFYNIGKANVEVIEGGATVRGEEWNKIVDHDLGIELAYPPDFGLTGERLNENSLHIYRQIGYGERLHCNESGEPRPHALSDSDIYLSVEDSSFSEYLNDWGMDSLEDFVSSNGGEVKVFNDGRKYYEWVHGVEMCNARTTIVPLNDGRLAMFDEPLIGDALEELLDGRQQFAYWDRVAIFGSIQSLRSDPEKATRNEVVSEFEPKDDSTESRVRAEALGITPREFHLKLGGRGDVNPFPRAVVYDREVKLITYPLEWKTSRYIFEVLDTAGGTLLRDEPGGIVRPEFIDLDQDGIMEARIGYDGGGNTSACLENFYRFYRTTEKDITVLPIPFIRTANIYQGEYPEQQSSYIDCSWEGNAEIENGTYVYKAHEWKYTNDPRLEPRLQTCDEEEVTFAYDGKAFHETSRVTLHKDVSMDGWGRTPYCYIPANPPWLQ